MKKRPLPLLSRLILCTVGALAAVVGGCLLPGMREKRGAFVGQTDPASGLRCRFTLSAAWQKQYNRSPLNGNPFYIDMAVFTASPQGSIKRWIGTHLLHQSAAPGWLPRVSLIGVKATILPHYLHIQAGYPELLSALPPSALHRHLMIDGCPATQIAYEDRDRTTGAPIPNSALLVYLPASSSAYIVSGFTENRYRDQLNHEMQAIIDSFHVEKDTGPPHTGP